MPPDLDILRDKLTPLDMKYQFGGVAYWPHLLDLNPREIEQNRLKMFAYLARYGRIDPFAHLDREINELRALHRAISEIVEKENDLSTRAENA